MYLSFVFQLYHVMVDNEEISKKLLKNGQLQSRTTFVPLNKVRSAPVDRRIVDAAQRLVGEENVTDAMSLIDFPEETRPAMQYAFGQTLICKDMAVAKRVAFDRNVQRKCITLQGDVVDPAGTLSGGAAAKGGSILLKLDEVKEAQNVLNEKERSLNEINNRIANIHKTADRYNAVKRQYNVKHHELDMVMQRLQKTTHHQLKEEV